MYSSSFVGPIEDAKLLQDALDNEGGAIQCDYPLPEIRSLSRTDAMETGLDLAASFEKSLDWLKEKHPRFIFSGDAKWRRVAESLGSNGEAQIEHTYELCTYSLAYKHKDSAGIMDGWFGKTFLYNVDIESSVESYSPFLEAFEKSVDIKPGQIPVVFIHSGQLFSKILESARVDSYKKGVGLFKDKLGEQIVSEKLTLMDVSYRPEWMALNVSDSAGMVRQDPVFPILEKGVFKNLICDTRNAAKYNREPTGNSMNFKTGAGLGYNSICIQKGERSAREILGDLPECLIVEMASGGDFTDTGDFSTPVQNAFLFRNGIPAGKVPQITLTSSVEKMLGDQLIEVAADPIVSTVTDPAIFTQMNVILN